MDNLFEGPPVDAPEEADPRVVFGKDPKPYMSWSQVSMFLTCGERYRRVYVCGHRAPPGIAMLCGVGAHAGIELNMRHKLDHGVEANIDEVTNYARTTAQSKLEKEGVHILKDDAEEIGSKADGKVREYVGDRTEMFTRLHYTAMAPYIDPLLVEHKFRLTTKGFPFDLVGIVDLQQKPTGANEVGAIRDTKSKAKDDKYLAAKSDQLTLYALWGRQVYGKIPPLSADLLIGTKKPKAYSQFTTRDDNDIEVLSHRIEAIADAKQKGVFLPAPADSFMCSERFCGFAGTCRYFRNKTTVPKPELPKEAEEKKDE